jgi:hypothetical protein
MELGLPRPAWYLDDAEVLAARHVVEGADPADLPESGAEASDNFLIHFLVLFGVDGEHEGAPDIRKRDVRGVENDGADLDRLGAGSPHAESAASRKQGLIGADQNRLALLELGREGLLFDVGHRSDAVPAALGKNLIDELVGRGQVKNRQARLVHD